MPQVYGSGETRQRLCPLELNSTAGDRYNIGTCKLISAMKKNNMRHRGLESVLFCLSLGSCFVWHALGIKNNYLENERMF